ncbi:MAG: acetate/propionate family kinase [Candidatus Peregrinibacteria bacterium]|nr:acetate/propionate family kinase [Candidatus Peregrinibacteria bacterium]
MKTLVINAGSSSLKYKLFDRKNFTVLAKNLIEVSEKSKTKTIDSALKLAMKEILDSKKISSLKEIEKIGHRVVHGGEKYSKTTEIDKKLIEEIRKLFPLAPLHNSINLEGILACKKYLPHAKNYAIFDTSFYSTMPEKAYLYALPRELHKKYKIRKYGFHGTSHKFVTNKALQILKNKKAKIISCHLGNGVSITASVGGKAVDTTMGFTPLEGMMMGTRCGSIDPAITFYLSKTAKLSLEKIEEIYLKESGLKAISEISWDMRKIHKKALKKEKKAIFTIEMFSYHLAKNIAEMSASIQGIDAIVFTAGIGENAHYVREKTINYLSHFGISLDKKANRLSKEVISSKTSKSKVLVIKTDEELQIAKEISN